MQIEAIKVRRLYLDVANQIETLIKNGDIKLGERLPSERNLAVSFGVSRPTIREAMIALEIAGLVEIRTGSGIYALPPRLSQYKDLTDEGPGPFEILEARLMIEVEIAALAAARMNETQLQQLLQALEDMEVESAESCITEQADQRFHCIIAEASENSALASMVAWLWQLRNQSRISTLFHQRVREKGIHPSAEEHRSIYNALKSKDPMRAREAMRAHISRAIGADMAMLENEKIS